MYAEKPDFMKEPHEHGCNFSIDPDWTELTTKIMDACFTVHREMGPGLSEAIYQACLLEELDERGLRYECQKPLPIIYKGKRVSHDLYLDLLIEDKIILELKAAAEMHPVFQAQLMTYLKLTRKKIGYVVNFNVPLLKNGIKRVKNGY